MDKGFLPHYPRYLIIIIICSVFIFVNFFIVVLSFLLIYGSKENDVRY